MESLKCVSPNCLWDLILNQYFVLQADRKTKHKVDSTVFSIKWKILIPINISKLCIYMGSPGGSSGKEFATNAGDVRDIGLIPGSGRSPGGEDDNPLKHACLENPMDRGTWRATVHRVNMS